MDDIIDVNQLKTFDFSKIELTTPTPSGGSYFIRFLIDSKYLYLQTPKCFTKQGIQQSGKRFYTDLVFTNENDKFIQWMSDLESYCQSAIYESKDKWFDGEMELHDIENYFTPVMKVFKSGKLYSTRININTLLGKPNIKIYDENETEHDIKSITDKTQIINILEIKGIRCSAKSFQIELDIKQIMILSPEDLFEKCLLIKTDAKESKNIKDAKENVIFTEKPNLDNLEKTEEVKMKNVILKEKSNINTTIVPKPTDISGTMLELDEPLTDSVAIEIEDIDIDKKDLEIEEVSIHLDKIEENDNFKIKERNEVFYEIYKEARKKAKLARDLALTAYLEAKEIKNKYMLDDINDSEDSDMESEDNILSMAE